MSKLLCAFFNPVLSGLLNESSERTFSNFLKIKSYQSTLSKDFLNYTHSMYSTRSLLTQDSNTNFVGAMMGRM